MVNKIFINNITRVNLRQTPVVKHKKRKSTHRVSSLPIDEVTRPLRREIGRYALVNVITRKSGLRQIDICQSPKNFF